MSQPPKKDINYGPLKELVGVWKGDKGLDIAPESDGTEKNLFYENITITEAGDTTNAESQKLAILHYRKIVQRISTHKIIHDQTGYWMWDAENNVIMHSLSIPRAVSLIAGTKLTEENYKDGKLKFQLEAGADNEDWPIIQSPFMKEKALTKTFLHKIEVENGKLKYEETTLLDIYGKEFEHTDKNELVLQ